MSLRNSHVLLIVQTPVPPPPPKRNCQNTSSSSVCCVLQVRFRNTSNQYRGILLTSHRNLGVAVSAGRVLLLLVVSDRFVVENGRPTVSMPRGTPSSCRQAGADANAAEAGRRDTPLIAASGYGHLEVVRLLLAARAEVWLGSGFRVWSLGVG